MNHHDHVNLLRKGIIAPAGVWADLGAGDGAFTLALADLIGTGGTIYAVDKDGGALRRLAQAMQVNFPTVTLHTQTGDFTRPLDLPLIDGIVMANSLHYVRDKGPALEHIRGYLKPEGRLPLVEYNTDRGNMWVPHPMSFGTWQSLSARHGFRHTELLATHPSRFLGEFFASASLVNYHFSKGVENANL